MTTFWDSLKSKQEKLQILTKNLVLMKTVMVKNQETLKRFLLEIKLLKTMEFLGKT
jgi:hypothetical protein